MNVKIDLKVELEKVKIRKVEIEKEIIKIQGEINRLQQMAHNLNVESIQLAGFIKGLELGIQNG